MAPAATAAAAWGSTRPLWMRLSASGSDCEVWLRWQTHLNGAGWRTRKGRKATAQRQRAADATKPNDHS